MAATKAELACVYAALVLVDDDVAVTVSTKLPSPRVFNTYFRTLGPLLSRASRKFSLLLII